MIDLMVEEICTGNIGYYLSKTYLETKNRPIYICKEQNITASSVQQNNEEMDVN